MSNSLVTPKTIRKVLRGKRRLGVNMTRVLCVKRRHIYRFPMNGGYTILILLPKTGIGFVGVRQFIRRESFFLPNGPITIHPLMTKRIVGLKNNTQSNLLIRNMKIHFRRRTAIHHLGNMFMTIVLKGAIRRHFPSLQYGKNRKINYFKPVIGIANRDRARNIKHPRTGDMNAFFCFVGARRAMYFVIFTLIRRMSQRLVFFFGLFRSVVSLFDSIMIVLVLAR